MVVEGARIAGRRFVGREGFRRAGYLVRRLAGHFDVAAQGEQADPVVGFSVLEAEEARPEAEGERLDAYLEELGNGKMSKLVDNYHYADKDDESCG